jgi:tetratricopeptide (TPR) repeat protein
MGACLDDNTVADFVDGRLVREQWTEVAAHLDGCASCHALVVAAAPPAASSSTATALPLLQTAAADAGEIASATAAAAPPAEHLRGAVIDRYVVIGRVGAGAMGEVYAAYDPDLDRKVALKLLRTGVGSGSGSPSDLRARLLREGQAMARLSHPSVVPIFDVGSYRDQIFIAMEFIDGGTLREWMKRRPPPAAVLALMVRAGEGLRAAHQAGIVHRDFKPDNVLVEGGAGEPPSEPVRVRVTDFGLATAAHRRSAERDAGADADADADADATAAAAPSPRGPGYDRLTLTGSVLGTPAYMAPEQMEGRPGPRADQFSFCVTLYEALYGTRPFAGATMAELARSMRANRVVAAAPGSRVPGWLRRVVLRGLRADPEQRWPSMDALLVALQPPGRRLKRVAAAAVGVAVLGTAGFTWHSVRSARALECHGAADKLAGVWDAPVQSTVERAFADSGRPYAATSFAGTRRILDEYAAGWTGMHRDACVATRVRREQSAELLDLRMLCLDDRLRELRALTSVLGRANGDVVDHAADAATRLTSVSECADVRALTSKRRPSRDPAVVVQVKALREREAELMALDNTGQYERALAIGQQALAAARPLGDPSLRADLAQETATLLLRLGKLDEGVPLLHESAQAAEMAHHDAAIAEAWIKLIMVYGVMQSHSDEGLRWAEYARAALARAGNPDGLMSMLLDTEGQVLAQAGRADEAVTKLRQAVALAEKDYGKSSMTALHMASDMGMALASQGRYDEARAIFRHAMEVQEKSLGATHPDTLIAVENYGAMMVAVERGAEVEPLLRRGLEARRKILGPKHPFTATAMLNLAEAYADAHRWADALRLNQEALASLEETVGAAHPFVAEALTNEGIDALGLGKPSAAVPALERALAIHGTIKSTPIDAAVTRFALARALVASAGDRARAQRLAEAARQAYADSAQQFGGYAATRRDQVATWLAAHAHER